MEGLERELGRLAEAVENAKEERSDMKRLVEKVGDLVNDLHGAVRELKQMVQSSSAQLSSLASEKCGARLDALETKTRHYDRILGTANSFIWKAIAALFLAAITGGGIVKLLDRL